MSAESGACITGRVGIEMRPDSVARVYLEVRHDHGYHQRAGAQSRKNSESDEQNGDELNLGGYIHINSKRMLCRKSPQKEGLLRSVQSYQKRED